MIDNSTVLSIGAFIISLVSLYFSIRKQRFEEETATSDQEAAIISKLADLKVQNIKAREKLASLRANWPQCMIDSINSLDHFDKAFDVIDRSNDNLFANISNKNRLTYRRAKHAQGYLDAQEILQSYITSNISNQLEIAKKPCVPCSASTPHFPSTEAGAMVDNAAEE